MHAGLGGKLSSIRQGRTGFQEDQPSEVCHQKKRRLAILTRKLTHLKQHWKDGKSALFRIKQTFPSPVYPKDHSYGYHEEWLAEWREASGNQFFVP